MKEINKNILVVGGGGFVGRALAAELIETGNNIFLTTRKKNFRFPGAKIFYGDLDDKLFCRKILKNIDLVYYLAGSKKNLSFHIREPFDYLLGNVEPFLAFLNCLRNSRVKQLVYLSSIIVDYALEKPGEFDGYVVGKYVNELLLKAFQRQSKIDVKLIRSAPIYGPGDNFDQRAANFIPAMINKVTRAKNELLIWGKGTRKLQFIYIDDLVRNLLVIPKRKKTFFVCGNSEIASINEVVKKIIKIFGKKFKIKHDLERPDKPTRLTRFHNAVAPRVSLEEGLRKTVEYYQSLWPRI